MKSNFFVLSFGGEMNGSFKNHLSLSNRAFRGVVMETVNIQIFDFFILIPKEYLLIFS